MRIHAHPSLIRSRERNPGMRMQPILMVLFVALFVSPALARASAPTTTADQARWQQRAAAVTITRDDWGIPHIHGKTDADAVFGMMFAQAEDDFDRIEVNYLTQLGWLARSQGAEAIWSDLRAQMYFDHQRLQRDYATSPAWLQQLMDAWADGLNYFLATHPGVHPRVIDRFQPWMALAFTEGSIGGDVTFVSLPKLAAFYGDHSVAYAGPEPRGRQAGSNGIAIAPALTANGKALLLINPHVTFYFRTELQVSSDEGLDAYGAATWGQFFLYQGFNRHVGWMHTSTGADAIDEFTEVIVKQGDGYVYRSGSRLVPVRERKVTIEYRAASGTPEARTFTVFATGNGPVTAKTVDRWISTRVMDRPVAQLQQNWLRMQSRDLASFRKVSRFQANSSNNTVFADDRGEIAMLMPQFIPRRDPRFDYSVPVDGSDPATTWQGPTPLDALPDIVNPPNGWVVNTNNAPWFGAGAHSPRRADFPEYMDTLGQNQRGAHALQLLDGARDFTIAKLTSDAYDSYLPAFASLLPVLLADYDSLPPSSTLKRGLAGPVAVLRGWDRRWGATSIPTTLAVLWGDSLWKAMRIDEWSEQMSSYAELAAATASKVRLETLARAVDKLQADFGTWAVPWGAFNRFQRLNDDIVPDSCFCADDVAANRQTFDDAKPSIPVPFTSARWGSLASFDAHDWPGTRHYYGFLGNSFVAVVEFGQPRVRAFAVKVGGQSGHPGSPHFADQAERYSLGNLRQVYFWPDELSGHVQRTYRPGQRDAEAADAGAASTLPATAPSQVP